MVHGARKEGAAAVSIQRLAQVSGRTYEMEQDSGAEEAAGAARVRPFLPRTLGHFIYMWNQMTPRA